MSPDSKELTDISDCSQRIHLRFDDITIPTGAYNHNLHSRKHQIEQPESKIDPTIKINGPPKYFRLDRPDGNNCPRLYKKCHGKDVTCIADSKKYENCEEYQKYLAKHPKKNGNHHNHTNSTNNNSGLEDKTVQ